MPFFPSVPRLENSLQRGDEASQQYNGHKTSGKEIIPWSERALAIGAVVGEDGETGDAVGWLGVGCSAGGSGQLRRFAEVQYGEGRGRGGGGGGAIAHSKQSTTLPFLTGVGENS